MPTCALVVSCVLLVGHLPLVKPFRIYAQIFIEPGGKLDIYDKPEACSEIIPQCNNANIIFSPQFTNNELPLQNKFNHELNLASCNLFKELISNKDYTISCLYNNNYFTQNVNKESVDETKKFEINHAVLVNEMETLLMKTKTLLYKWEEYKKQNAQIVSTHSSRIDYLLKKLIFTLIPNVVNQLSLSVDLYRKSSHFPDQSDILQSPYLLDIPSVQRSVSHDNEQSFLNKVLRQLKTKKHKKTNKENKDVEAVKRTVNPYYEYYSDWKWPSNEGEEEKKKHDLEKTIQNQELLINRMTFLENELEKLKTKNKYQPNKQNEIRMERIEKQLELLEEKNSELYYKKQMYSQRTVY